MGGTIRWHLFIESGQALAPIHRIVSSAGTYSSNRVKRRHLFIESEGAEPMTCPTYSSNRGVNLASTYSNQRIE